MRNGRMAALAGMILVMCSTLTAMQPDDPGKKLSVLVGKWETEGTFAATGSKVSSTLECRWSPQGNYLVCEQRVSGSDPHQQLTIYSYNRKQGDYSCTTFRDPGSSPGTGTVNIQGSVWTYSNSFGTEGKKTEVRTTNIFASPGAETFKVETSDDGGEHWKTVVEGKGKKISD
jgi:hypothetical protein